MAHNYLDDVLLTIIMCAASCPTENGARTVRPQKKKALAAPNRHCHHFVVVTQRMFAAAVVPIKTNLMGPHQIIPLYFICNICMLCMCVFGMARVVLFNFLSRHSLWWVYRILSTTARARAFTEPISNKLLFFE